MSDIVAQLTDTRYPGQLEMRFEAAAEINKLRALVRRGMAFVSEPAGMTEEVIRDSEKFRAFMRGVESRQKAWLSDASAALVGLPVPTTESPAKP